MASRTRPMMSLRLKLEPPPSVSGGRMEETSVPQSTRPTPDGKDDGREPLDGYSSASTARSTASRLSALSRSKSHTKSLLLERISSTSPTVGRDRSIP